MGRKLTPSDIRRVEQRIHNAANAGLGAAPAVEDVAVETPAPVKKARPAAKAAAKRAAGAKEAAR